MQSARSDLHVSNVGIQIALRLLAAPGVMVAGEKNTRGKRGRAWP